MTRILFFVSFLLLFFLLSCHDGIDRDPLGHIEDTQIKTILEKGFSSAGGIARYLSLQEISFRKKSILYFSNGEIESEVDQLHNYTLQPELKGKITWEDSRGNHEISYSPNNAYRSLNGIKTHASEKSATESFLSNYYVLFLPFKLADQGVKLVYEGIVTLENGQKTDVIKATYDPANNENHSTSDDWYLFFNREDGKVLANLVYHDPTYAYIENLEATDEFPLRMNLYRQTWRTDKARNKEFLRGEFWYSEYSFNPPK